MFLIPVLFAAVVPALGLSLAAEAVCKGATKVRTFREASGDAAALVALAGDTIDPDRVEAANEETMYTPAGGAEKLLQDAGLPKRLASGLASQLGHDAVLLPSQAMRIAALTLSGDEEALRSLLVEVRLQSRGHV